MLNLWLLTIGSQGEAKVKTIEMNGTQKGKSLWTLSNIRTKTGPCGVKTCNRGQNTFREYFFDYT